MALLQSIDPPPTHPRSSSIRATTILETFAAPNSPVLPPHPRPRLLPRPDSIISPHPLLHVIRGIGRLTWCARYRLSKLCMLTKRVSKSATFSFAREGALPGRRDRRRAKQPSYQEGPRRARKFPGGGKAEGAAVEEARPWTARFRREDLLVRAGGHRGCWASRPVPRRRGRWFAHLTSMSMN